MGTRNIIVFDIEPIEVITDKSDLQLLYEELKKSGKLESRQYDIFYQMDLDALKKQIISSTVVNLSMESILDYFIPIVSELPPTLVNKKPLKEEESELTSQNKMIAIKLKEPKECVFKDIFICAAKKSTIKISGVLYDDYLTPDKSILIESFPINVPHRFIKPRFKLETTNISKKTYNAIDFKNSKKEVELLKTAIVQLNEIYDTYNIFQIEYFNSIFGISTPYIQAPYQPFKDTSLFNKILNINVSSAFKFTTLLAANNAGYYTEYNKLQLPDPINKDTVETLKYKAYVRDFRTIQMFNKFQIQIELFQKKRIALKKFKVSDVSKLTASQLDIVNKEYNIQKPHEINPDDKNLTTEFQRAVSVENEQVIKQLMPKAKEIQKKDNSLLICEHTIMKAELLIQKYKDIFEKSKYIQSKLISIYGIDFKQGIFCKVCGELLVETHVEDIEDLKDYSNANDYDNLYIIISREVIYILSTYVHFAKSTALNLREISRNISDTIKGQIREVEANIIKVKTVQKESIKATIDAYIYIYTFAAICQLIYTNHGSISFVKEYTRSSTVGGDSLKTTETKPNKTKPNKTNIDKTKIANTENTKNTDNPINDDLTSPFIEPTEKGPDQKIKQRATNNTSNKADLQKIINDALHIVKLIKADDIRKSEFISADGVKNTLLGAYRWILNKKYISIKQSNMNYWIQNSFLDYLLWGYNLAHETTGKQRLPYIAKNQTFLYFDKIKNDDEKNITEKSLEKVLGRTYEQIQRGLDKESIFATAPKPKTWDDKYKSDSLQMTYEYVKEKLYKENPIASQKLTDFYKKFEHLKEPDNAQYGRYINRCLRPCMSLNFIKNINVIIPGCVCEEYDIFYLEPGSKNRKKITPKEVQNWIEAKEYKKLDDYYTSMRKNGLERKCIKCRVKDSGKKDEKIIFYGFFEYHCPKGDLHEFTERRSSDKQSCSKCGITQRMIDERDEAYYKKYKDLYVNIKNTEKKLINNQFQIKKTHEQSPEIKFPKYSVNFSSITELLKIIKINENEFYNIGLFERNTYDDVKQGKINTKTITVEGNIKRNNSLYDYYLGIIRMYYLMKNSELMSIYPKELKEFLDKHSNKGVSSLDNINEDVLDKCKFYRKTLEPAEFSTFLLQLISLTLLTIYKQLSSIKKQEMAKEFIQLLYDKIIQSEKKLTIFIVKKTKLSFIMEDVEEGADNNTKDLGIEEADEDEQQENDPFSIEEMDVEMDEEGNNDNLYKDVEDKL